MLQTAIRGVRSPLALELTYTCSAVSTGGGAGLSSPVDRLKIKRCNWVSPVPVIADRTTMCVVPTQTLQLLGEVPRHVRRCLVPKTPPVQDENNRQVLS